MKEHRKGSIVTKTAWPSVSFVFNSQVKSILTKKSHFGCFSDLGQKLEFIRKNYGKTLLVAMRTIEKKL